MIISNRNNRISTLVMGISVLLCTGIYSCNNSTPKDATDEKKDTLSTSPTDTSMKMNMDTTKKDTSGKGTQPAPKVR